MLLQHYRLEVWRNPEYRSKDRKARADFLRFRDQRGGMGLRAPLLPENKPSKTALIVGHIYLPFAPLEALTIKAFQLAGSGPVILGKRGYQFMRYSWLAGNESTYTFDDFDHRSDHGWIDRETARLETLEDWLSLRYEGVHVGRFTIASTLRHFKVGKLAFSDPKTLDVLRRTLRASVRNTRGALKLFNSIKPDCVLVMDRGYTGQGEVFDLAIHRGIDVLTWNLGYKSNRLLFKRYNAGNERDHPLSPSPEMWNRLISMPWERESGPQSPGGAFPVL